MYNNCMTVAISKRDIKLVEAYLQSFNKQKAGEAVGYAPASARQTAYKNLQKPEVKEYLDKRFKELAMTPDEIITRLQAMADGDLPTTKITAPGKVKEEVTQKTIYDTRGALQDLAKVHALFIDKQVVHNIQGLEIEDREDPDTSPASETG